MKSFEELKNEAIEESEEVHNIAIKKMIGRAINLSDVAKADYDKAKKRLDELSNMSREDLISEAEEGGFYSRR